MLGSVVVVAQDNCTMTLKKVEQMFDEGRIEEIPTLLQSCLKDGFTRDQKVRAYELIIQTFLVDEKETKAEEYMLQLLQLDPHYKAHASVLISDFVTLYNSYKTKAVFTAGIKAGINTSQIQIIEEYGVHNLNEVKGEYSSNLAYLFGIDLNTSIGNNYEIGLEALYVRNSYNYGLYDAYAFSELIVLEEHNNIQVPIYGTYKYQIKNFEPYVKAGFATGFLIAGEMQIERNYLDNSHPNISSATLDNLSRRKMFNLSILASVGCRYIIDKGYVFVDVRYNKGLNNITNSDERYSDDDMIYKYYLLDDDVYLNSFSFSLGYSYSIFKAKKIEPEIE